MEETAVVMVGNPTDGWKIVGPFDTYGDAAEWADDCGGLDCWITTLYPPKAFAEHLPVIGNKE